MEEDKANQAVSRWEPQAAIPSSTPTSTRTPPQPIASSTMPFNKQMHSSSNRPSQAVSMVASSACQLAEGREGPHASLQTNRSP